jgi:hypothetical protein
VALVWVAAVLWWVVVANPALAVRPRASEKIMTARKELIPESTSSEDF